MEICLLCTEEHRKGNSLSKELENGFTVGDAIKQYFTSSRQLLSDLTSTSICVICFKTLRNFYEFTSQIDERFPSELFLKSPEKNEFPDTPGYEVVEEDFEDFKTESTQDEKVIYFEEEHLDENLFEVVEEKPKKGARKKVTAKRGPGRPKKNQPVTASRRAHPKNDIEGDQKIKNLVEMKCHECDTEFDKFLDVTKHFRTFHPNIPAYLICCNKKFTKRAILLDHVEFHDKSAIYRCEECNKDFRSKAILKQHQRKFHVEVQEPVQCNECGKFFSNKYTLKTHMKSHIVDESRSFECYICKKTFKNHEKLLDHFKYRHDPAHNRTSVCHLCSKTVTRLDIHLSMVHSSEPVERVRCEICGHNLKVTSLKGHMRKHKETEGFNCEICNQFLKNKNTLNCHMKRVHGEGKFKCEYCGKGYHQRGHLQDHIACQHTGKYLHKCRVEGCNKQFRNVGRRGLHEKRMHPIDYETRFKPIYLRDNVEIVEYLDDTSNVEEDRDVDEIVMEFEVVKSEDI